MHRLSPSLDPPAHLAPRLALLEIGKLPKMMHGVQVADLDEPRAHALHDLSSGFQSLTPVGLPFQEVAGVQGVGAEFEEAAEFAGRCGGPEGELLHQGGFFVGYKAFEVDVEVGEFGVRGDAVEGGMVAVVALVFPDMDCTACVRQDSIMSMVYVLRRSHRTCHSRPLLFSNSLPDVRGSPPERPSGDTNRPRASRTRPLCPA